MILRVDDHRPAGVPPLKDVERQVQEAIYFSQLQPALRAYLTKAREDAYIDIKPGFVDTGPAPSRPSRSSRPMPLRPEEEEGGREAALRAYALHGQGSTKPPASDSGSAVRTRPSAATATRPPRPAKAARPAKAEEDPAREDSLRAGSRARRSRPVRRRLRRRATTSVRGSLGSGHPRRIWLRATRLQAKPWPSPRAPRR